MLRKPAKRHPNAVFHRQLLVFLEPLSSTGVFTPLLTTFTRLVSKSIWETNKFGTTIDAFFGYTLDVLVVLFKVFR